MSESDVFLLPSVFEGTPLTLMEAMHSGLPIVTTDVCGMRDVIRNGESGILVPIRSPGNIAQAINQLAGDSELRQRLGRRVVFGPNRFRAFGRRLDSGLVPLQGFFHGVPEAGHGQMAVVAFGVAAAVSPEHDLVRRQEHAKPGAVVIELEEVQVDTNDAIQADDIVLIPAFGVPAADMELLRNKRCVIVDTTCGSVLNVWKNVERYARSGVTSVIHGKFEHEGAVADITRTYVRQQLRSKFVVLE